MKRSKETKRLLEDVEFYCTAHGIRFTEPRRLVLTIISESKKPLGAYDILDLFGKWSKNPKPPTIYRAIDFLQSHGFIHKIESLNSFVSCHAGHTHKGSQFAVCDNCGTVEEVHLCDVPDSFQKQLKKSGFKLGHWNVELHGQCHNCRS